MRCGTVSQLGVRLTRCNTRSCGRDVETVAVHRVSFRVSAVKVAYSCLHIFERKMQLAAETLADEKPKGIDKGTFLAPTWVCAKREWVRTGTHGW